MDPIARPDEERSGGRPVLAWAIFGGIALALVGTGILAVPHGSFDEDSFGVVFGVAAILCYGAVGAIVAARVPRNPVGWLILAVSLTFQLTVLSDEFITAMDVGGDRGGTLFDAVVWLQGWLFFGTAALPLIILLFPDGHPPTRRWRALVWVIVVAAAVGALAAMVTPGPIDDSLTPPPTNPLGIGSLEAPLRAIGTAVGWVFIAAVLASIAGMVVRWRRARGVERRQLRLLVSVVLLAVAVFALMLVIGRAENTALTTYSDALFFVLFVIIGVGIPVAMGAAILRYRMYDLEVVIRKTVRFAVVAVMIALAAGAALVLGSTTLMGGVPSIDDPELVLGVVLGILILPLWRISRRIADRLVFGGRATPYEVLTAFSARMGESYATDDVLPRMASVLGNAVGATHADVWLGVGEDRRQAAGWPDDEAPPGPVPDPVPVAYQGEELGALSVVMPANDPMDEGKRSLIDDLAAQAGPVLHNVRLLEDLRDSRRRIVTAQDERARKLERDIHDGVQQQLVAFAVKLRLADQLIDRDPARAHDALATLQDDAGQALDDLRDLARGIYPPLLADKGLTAALDAQARKAAVPIHVRAGDVGRFSRDVEAAVYFCTLEALNNAAKYAEATAVTVTLERTDGRLSFTVADDGRGFDPDRTTYGTGMQGMRDRLDAVGGSLQVEAVPGAGVRVTGRLPVEGVA